MVRVATAYEGATNSPPPPLSPMPYIVDGMPPRNTPVERPDWNDWGGPPLTSTTKAQPAKTAPATEEKTQEATTVQVSPPSPPPPPPRRERFQFVEATAHVPPPPLTDGEMIAGTLAIVAGVVLYAVYHGWRMRKHIRGGCR